MPPRRSQTDLKRFNPSWGPAGTRLRVRHTAVGGCFNPSWGPAGTGEATRTAAAGFASTPRGVLLEPATDEQIADDNDRFNPSWGPAGTRSCPGRVRSPTRFNPSWGPAGTGWPSLARCLSVALQPLVGSCWNFAYSLGFQGSSSLQPLVGSCWNHSRSGRAPMPRGRFNPSWGPAGTRCRTSRRTA